MMLFAVVGCGGGGDAASPSSNASAVVSTTQSGTSPTPTPAITVADQQYTVAAGDALYAIADSFCTTADAIVAANAWSDGVNHPLFPGDPITVPGAGCGATGSSVATSAGGDTATATNPYLQQFIDQGVVFNPFDGDPADYDDRFGPLCDAAWSRTYEFLQHRATKADTLETLEALAAIGAPEVPAKVAAFMASWEEFVLEWGPVYDAAVSRAEAARIADYNDYYLALLSDPEYVEFLTAYEAFPRAADSDPHQWVITVCTPIADTANSTP